MEIEKCMHGNGPEYERCKAMDIPEVEEVEQEITALRNRVTALESANADLLAEVERWKGVIKTVIDQYGDPEEEESLATVVANLQATGNDGWGKAGFEMERCNALELRAKSAEEQLLAAEALAERLRGALEDACPEDGMCREDRQGIYCAWCGDSVKGDMKHADCAWSRARTALSATPTTAQAAHDRAVRVACLRELAGDWTVFEADTRAWLRAEAASLEGASEVGKS